MDNYDTIEFIGAYYKTEELVKITDYNGWSIIYYYQDELFHSSIFDYMFDLRQATNVIGANTYSKALTLYNELNGNEHLSSILYDIDNLAYSEVFGFQQTKERKAEELRLKLAYSKHFNTHYNFLVKGYSNSFYIETSIYKDDTSAFCLDNGTLIACKGYIDSRFHGEIVYDIKTYTDFLKKYLSSTEEDKIEYLLKMFAPISVNIVDSYTYNDDDWLEYVGTEEDYINEDSFNQLY